MEEKVECGNCGGTGVSICEHCDGDLTFETRSGDPCPACGGDGKHKCVGCNGRGYNYEKV